MYRMLCLVLKKVQMFKITPSQIATVQLKKILHQNFPFLKPILSAKICILETRYNWSSDINKHFFHFWSIGVNFAPFLS